MIISFDRLTRFKPAGEKYFRVFCDILTTCLIEPKFKKSEFNTIPANQLKDFAQTIINNSLEDYSAQTETNFLINKKLQNYENSVFVCDEYTQTLLDNKINYDKILPLIEPSDAINLIWLKSLATEKNSIKAREEKCLKYPIEKVLLVEGLTEEILLPAFSKFLGYDFYKTGVQIIPAGGKNQVVKLYYKLSQEIKVPIYLLLDKDAADNIRQITPRLRKIDKIHLVSCGEFEDLLPKSLIVKTVNKDLHNFASITEKDLPDENTEVENLENIFKQKGLHEFKKADFAKMVKENINSQSDISDEIREIINGLK